MKRTSPAYVAIALLIAAAIAAWVFVPTAPPRRGPSDDGTPAADADQGWEGFRNRLPPENVHLVRQDFGWIGDGRRAGGAKAGEIGGWVQRSITPAYYAKAIKPRTLDDAMSASGTFVVTRAGGGSGALFGWFNQKASRGWRTPNSLTFRIDGNGGNYWVFFEYGTRNWLTAGKGTFDGAAYQTTKSKPFLADGTVHRWTLSYDPKGAAGDGLVAFVLDGTHYELPLEKDHKADGAAFDMFGLFNQQTTGGGMEVFVDDLVIEGNAEDLAADPNWEALGNETEFEDRAIRPYHDFGRQAAANGGAPKTEIGGLIWRDEKPAYYADRVGPFTLDDEFEASGVVTLTAAGSDGGAAIGFFDSRTKQAKATPEDKEKQPNVLAIRVEGPSRIGHYFYPFYRDSAGGAGETENGPLIRPDGEPHKWLLHYSPKEGNGRITVRFDDSVQTLALKPEDRKRGATFDRFGLFNLQSGGHYVYLYVDELKYTKARK